MKRLILLIALLSLIPTGLVMATADVSDAIYRAPIAITNTGAAASAVSCNVNISTPALIAGGFANSSVDNVAILTSGGSDVTFMPGYNTNPWMVFISSMAATSSQSMTLYTDNSTGGVIRWFPGTAGGTMADSATIEPANNLTSTIKGYVNMATSGDNQTLIFKDGSWKTWVSGANTISTAVYDAGVDPIITTSTVTIRPNGDNTTGLAISTGAAHYTEVDEAVANDADYVGTTAAPGAGEEDYYDYEAVVGPVAGDTINWIKYYVRFAGQNFASPGYLTPVIRSGVKTSSEAQTGSGASGVYTTYSWTFTLLGGAAITVADLADLQGGYTNVFCDGANWIRISQAYMEVNYTNTVPGVPKLTTQVDSTVASGEHTVSTTWDGTNLRHVIDGIYTDNATTPVGWLGTISDNATSWYWATNDTMPYVEYIETIKSGVQKQYVEWQYGATFTDQSGNGQNITPSFRTTTSDADVTATLGAFAIISPAAAGSSVLPSTTDNWTSSDNGTSSFSTTITPTMPGADIIAAISTASGTPSQLPFTWISGLIILIISMALSYFMRANNAMSLTTKMAMIFLFMLVAVVTSIYDAWMIILWLPLAIALAMGSKQYGW